MALSKLTNAGPSTNQTPAGRSSIHGLNVTQAFNADASFDIADKSVLRELARRVAELAVRPEEDRKKNLWRAHNDLETQEPLVFCDPENGWNEIITKDQLRCHDPLAREWEIVLRKEIFWGEEIKDDRVIEPFFNVPYRYSDSGWGLQQKKIGGNDGGSYTWEAPIIDWERDFAKLRYPEITVHEEDSGRILRMAKEIFDGLLTVRQRGTWWWSLGMTWDFINLRGLENFMLDLYDNPEWIHKTLAFLRDGTLRMLDRLGKDGLLALNTEGTYVGSGGFGWTNQLPATGFDPNHVRLQDMWGFCESQETVGVSTEMFEEFVFAYQLPILERFGLNCYGCCEPVDVRWDVIKRIPRLRRVSASPWADRTRITEQLKKNYVMSLKPSPAPLAQFTMDEDLVRDTIRRDLNVTRGGIVEYIMKDNNTLGGNPKNATRWVEMVREEIGRM